MVSGIITATLDHPVGSGYVFSCYTMDLYVRIWIYYRMYLTASTRVQTQLQIPQIGTNLQVSATPTSAIHGHMVTCVMCVITCKCSCAWVGVITDRVMVCELVTVGSWNR